MRTLLVVALTLTLLAGCKKFNTKSAGKTTPNTPTPQGNSDQPAVHAPTGVVLNPGGGGGSGGAAQAVRKAAVRSVNQNELNNIRLFIDSASSANGQMPSAQEVAQALQREAPSTYKLIEEKAIILTGTRSREGIWAYTWEAQSVTGEHLIVNSAGVSRMDPQTLRQRLQQQGQ